MIEADARSPVRGAALPAGTVEPAGAESPEDRLADRLLKAGRLNRIQLAYARQKAAVTGERLSQVVMRLGLAGEREVLAALSECLGVAFVPADACPPPCPRGWGSGPRRRGTWRASARMR